MLSPGGWFLIGAPWDCSGTGRGERAAPDALRGAGLSDLVGRDVGDCAASIDSTERDQHSGVIALPETVGAAHALASALEDAMRDAPGRRPLVLGGDCSILLGVFPALRRSIGSVGLWFVDGHPDYLVGFGSATGETADMDLALLTGEGPTALTTLAGNPPMLAVSDAVLVGHRTRGLDDGARAELARLPAELRRVDAASVMADPTGSGRQAEAWLSEAGRRAWLHIDLDVLDPASMPAVTYPQPAGLDWAQLSGVLGPLARSPQLIGVSVADFRPDLDSDGQLAARVVELLYDNLP